MFTSESLFSATRICESSRPSPPYALLIEMWDFININLGIM